MKKIIGICLLFVMLSSLISVSAAGKAVVFTSSSVFEVGGTATVDEIETAGSVLDDGSVSSDLYNAALERNMTYTWRCSNGPDKQGKSVTWTEADAGREYYCRVSFYSDKACTEFVDYIDSEVFTVTGEEVEVIISPKGEFHLTFGVSFSLQLSCNVEDVTFDRFRTSLPDGLEISPDGLISGVPAKVGFWHTTIAVYQDDVVIGSEGFDFYVEKLSIKDPEHNERLEGQTPDQSKKPVKTSKPTATTKTVSSEQDKAPEKDPTAEVVPSQSNPPVQTTSAQSSSGQSTQDVLIWVLLAVLIVLLGTVVILAVVLIKRRQS